MKKLVLELTADDSLKSHDLRSVPLRDILTEAAIAVALNTTQTEPRIIHTPLGDGRSHLAGTRPCERQMSPATGFVVNRGSGWCVEVRDRRKVWREGCWWSADFGRVGVVSQKQDHRDRGRW